MNMTKITLKDIAKACKCGLSTVSTALHHPAKLSPNIVEHIVDKATELGYFKNKKLEIKKLLLVCNNLHNHFFGEYYSEVLYGVLARLAL